MHKGDTKNIYECMLLEDRIITILNGYIMKNIYECKLVEDRTITMHKRDVIKNIYIMKNIVESNVLDRVCFICYLCYYNVITCWFIWCNCSSSSLPQTLSGCGTMYSVGTQRACRSRAAWSRFMKTSAVGLQPSAACTPWTGTSISGRSRWPHQFMVQTWYVLVCNDWVPGKIMWKLRQPAYYWIHHPLSADGPIQICVLAWYYHVVPCWLHIQICVLAS